jgi:hypothetical protein
MPTIAPSPATMTPKGDILMSVPPFQRQTDDV